MLQAPPSEAPRSVERDAPGGGEFPSYDEYSIVYRAHWVLCSSGFSSQLIAALVGLQGAYRDTIRLEIVRCNSRDTMNLEALARFLNTFMDQYSPETLINFFDAENQHAFLETLLILIYYEPIRDVLLRIFNDISESVASLKGVTSQFLYQLAPNGSGSACDAIQSRIANDLPHQRFSRMVFTCDLLTDLIHERRTGSLGFFYVTEISTSPECATRLIDAASEDLRVLPTSFANESYAVKVLNSLLQQSQCGCVTKAAFLSNAPPEDEIFTQGSPHEDLPIIWKQFISRLAEFLQSLDLPAQKHFKTVHVQVIYLMLPILNVSCTAVDRQLMTAKSMETLLALITRFPAANILHCAISRLFIVALEDSPFMFGKELPAYRAANDPLRIHLLLQGCFQSVLTVFGSDAKQRSKPPPAFLDIAISFDQAVTAAHAHSPHLFCSETMNSWDEFRTKVLLPTQTIWEEQYEAAAPLPKSPRRASIAEILDPATGLSLPVPGVATKEEEAEHINFLQRAIAEATGTPALAHVSAPSEVSPATATKTVDDDVPTPLSALYNDEERSLMLRVASTPSPAPSSPVTISPSSPTTA